METVKNTGQENRPNGFDNEPNAVKVTLIDMLDFEGAYMNHTVRVVVAEKKDMFINLNADTVADAVSEVKKAIDLVGLSNMQPIQENILEQEITINEMDFDDIE